jgi:hypothetical protein
VSASTRLGLRVVPGAVRSGIVGRHGAGWKIRVAAPPEGGRANDAVIRLLAKTLDAGRSDVEIVAGRSGRDKIVEVAGIAPDELERRLDLTAAAG